MWFFQGEDWNLSHTSHIHNNIVANFINRSALKSQQRMHFMQRNSRRHASRVKIALVRRDFCCVHNLNIWRVWKKRYLFIISIFISFAATSINNHRFCAITNAVFAPRRLFIMFCLLSSWWLRLHKRNPA